MSVTEITGVWEGGRREYASSLCVGMTQDSVGCAKIVAREAEVAGRG